MWDPLIELPQACEVGSAPSPFLRWDYGGLRRLTPRPHSLCSVKGELRPSASLVCKQDRFTYLFVFPSGRHMFFFSFDAMTPLKIDKENESKCM